MTEAFLHYVWQNGFINKKQLLTEQKQPVKIIKPGLLNPDAGPDFLEAHIMIDDILWVGNVEIHKRSSDWYVHGHEKDSGYDNIILHVVFEDDMPVFDKNNRQIPTLVLSKYVSKAVLKNYNKLLKNKSILRCQNNLHAVDSFVITQFKYKLFIERLEDKNEIIKRLLRETNNDWEEIFYRTLLKYIGGAVNKDAFDLLGRLLPYRIFKRYRNELIKLEALLFGVAGLLRDDKQDTYYQLLKREFEFLRNKHSLEILSEGAVKFHRLRPPGFPTVRLAQFAGLCYQSQHLFERLMAVQNPEEAYEILYATASKYWDTHYTFEKTVKARKKTLGQAFMDVILINVVVPLKFAYQKYTGQEDIESIFDFIEQIKPEKNKIVNIFVKLSMDVPDALATQAILQLNSKYCLPKRCLSCDVGHYIIKQGLE